MSRVYLIFRNQIFGHAVSAVLNNHPEIHLVGATDEPGRVSTDVNTLIPDVILLEEIEDDPVVGAVHSLLTSHIPCRLITMQMEGDEMHVWSQTWQQSVRTQDLVEAIISAGDSQ